MPRIVLSSQKIHEILLKIALFSKILYAILRVKKTEKNPDISFVHVFCSRSKVHENKKEHGNEALSHIFQG